MRPGRMWNGVAGPPIDSGRRPTRIATVAQALAVDRPADTSSSRLWKAARACWRASAPARSGRRP
ncbi:hypothetical protein PIB30_116422, partial [Stylosanthes scabra]|nr:hypothetical protein [Stylosanthes scabra]